MPDNPFEAEGERATKHARRKMEPKQVKPPMVLSPLERKLKDQGDQLKRFRLWKRQIKEGLTTGDYAPEIIMLLRYLRKLPAPDELLRLVASSQWLIDGSANMRMSVLEYIDAAIIRWRIRHGLSPFDDGLPDEPDTPFVAIRRLLTKHGDTYQIKREGIDYEYL